MPFIHSEMSKREKEDIRISSERGRDRPKVVDAGRDVRAVGQEGLASELFGGKFCVPGSSGSIVPTIQGFE